MPNKKIIDILALGQQSYTPLAYLLKQSRLQASWTSQLRNLLPPELAVHCTVRELRHTTMIIQTSDATWATRLRFQQLSLIENLNKLADFTHISDIRIQVVAANKKMGKIRE
ncbi:MAG: DUF721 domain-containing protein [Pseudomonadales bacterium]|nr:DUF721 domain-containing protein [Pseudomonadales bacterium]